MTDRSKIILIALLGVAAMLATSTIPSAAAEHGERPPTTALGATANASPPDDPAFDVAAFDEADQDVASYAASFGVSFDEAARRSQIMDEIGSYLETVEKAAGDQFGYGYLRHEPDFFLEIGIKPGAELTAAAPPDGLEVEVRNIAYSRAELEAASRDVHDALSASEVGADYEIDFVNSTINIYVASASDRQTLDAQINALIKSTVPLTIDVVEALSEPSANLYGGLALSPCTSSFRITWNGQAAIMTAGHCNNNPTYSGQTLSYIHENFGGAYDRQANKPGTHTLKTWFYTGYSNRTPTGYSSRSYLGAFVCKYGKTTGYGCGTYTSISYDPSYVPGWGPYFGVLHHASGADMSTPGDSGGPVFYSYKAAGLISGHVNSGLDALVNRTNHAFGGSYALVY